MNLSVCGTKKNRAGHGRIVFVLLIEWEPLSWESGRTLNESTGCHNIFLFVYVGRNNNLR